METMNKGLAAVLVMVAASAAAFFYGQHVENKYLTAQHEKTLSGLNGAHANALVDEVAKARKQEQAAADHAAAIDKTLLEKRQHEIISKERIINDLRTGAVQLRDRFKCNASASGAVSETGTSASVSDAGTRAEFSVEDTEFFISEASRADVMVLQLQACQALVRSDRGQ